MLYAYKKQDLYSHNINIKMKLEDFISQEKTATTWGGPIPKKHTIAIFATVVLASGLALVMPKQTSNIFSNQQINALANLEEDDLEFDSRSTPIIAYDKHTQDLDNYDDNLSDIELEDSDKILEDNLKALAQKNNQQLVDAKWYVENIEKGDTLSSVFSDLNIPYATMQAITKQDQNKQLINLKPGQDLSFLLDEDNVLISFVKQINDKEQFRLIRKNPKDPDVLDFVLIREPLNSHLNKDLDELLKDVPATSSTAIAQNTKNENQKATVVAKNETKATKPAQRPRLVIVQIRKGQSFSAAAHNAGLSYSEIAQITQLFKGSIQFTRHIQPGDTMRVLFAQEGASKINAVEFNLKRLGKVATYRHLADNKFYDENGVNASTSGFMRFPLKGKVRISSSFNPNRRHPVTGRYRPHNGTDFAVPVGTPVYSPASGVVDKASYTRSTGYYIVIRHHGSYSTVYMHLSKLHVKAGQRVKLGTMIARSGNTGLSTGPHLHYELRINGRPVNAMKVNLPKNTNSAVPNKQRQRFIANVKQYKKDLYNKSLMADK